jgi:hypothetical protein
VLCLYSIYPCRQFLFDADRLIKLLGPFVCDKCDGAAALGITLIDVSAAASLAHARLALLQAATSLFASLSRWVGCVVVSCYRVGLWSPAKRGVQPARVVCSTRGRCVVLVSSVRDVISSHPTMMLLGVLPSITLDDVSTAASVAHARLALLQAATSLFASLSRYDSQLASRFRNTKTCMRVAAVTFSVRCACRVWVHACTQSSTVKPHCGPGLTSEPGPHLTLAVCMLWHC